MKTSFFKKKKQDSDRDCRHCNTNHRNKARNRGRGFRVHGVRNWNHQRRAGVQIHASTNVCCFSIVVDKILIYFSALFGAASTIRQSVSLGMLHFSSRLYVRPPDVSQAPFDLNWIYFSALLESTRKKLPIQDWNLKKNNNQLHEHGLQQPQVLSVITLAQSNEICGLAEIASAGNRGWNSGWMYAESYWCDRARGNGGTVQGELAFWVWFFFFKVCWKVSKFGTIDYEMRKFVERLKILEQKLWNRKHF